MALHVKLIEFLLTWLNSPHAGSFRSDLLVGWLKSNICWSFFFPFYLFIFFSRRNKYWTLETLMRYIPEIVFDQLFLCVRIYFIFFFVSWLVAFDCRCSYFFLSHLRPPSVCVPSCWCVTNELRSSCFDQQQHFSATSDFQMEQRWRRVQLYIHTDWIHWRHIRSRYLSIDVSLFERMKRKITNFFLFFFKIPAVSSTLKNEKCVLLEVELLLC